jgi:putative flippase GtrA
MTRRFTFARLTVEHALNRNGKSPHKMRLAFDPANLALVARYGFVGLAASAMYSGLVIAIVDGAGIRWPVLASIVAFAVTAPVAYLGHWAITFGRRQRLDTAWGRFIATTMASFAVAVGGMYVIAHLAHLPYYLGLVWTWIVVPAMNFLALRLWVFASSARALRGS